MGPVSRPPMDQLSYRLEGEDHLEPQAAPILPAVRLAVEAVERTSLRVRRCDVVVTLRHEAAVIEAGLGGPDRCAVRSSRSALGGIETRGEDQVLGDKH